ncbi:hypothetical protein [Bacillus cereus]|uniref:hypothetical protein n=1 Tax=Bacillus cereus TaxID=1396 RepID=UPI00112265C0|nr:hypothetical protein [Bacillus cereus]UDW09159.1 hypothetical protein FHP23_028935 [Bacillus cereus]
MLEQDIDTMPICSICLEKCLWVLKFPITIQYCEQRLIREVVDDNITTICIECLEKEIQMMS